MLILLTNDDGINSPGLRYLRDSLLKENEVYVVAPDRERTCSAHSITLHKPLRITEHSDKIFSTNGTPADCVLLAVKSILPRKPDLLISGINGGPNMGQDIFYSGTVAAAREGAFLKIRSLSVSIDARDHFRYEDASETVRKIVERIKKNPFPSRIFLNINIPNLPSHQIKGFMITSPGLRLYNDEVVERIDPRGRKYYWIGGSANHFNPKRGTDFFAVSNGFVSITPIDAFVVQNCSKEKIKKIFGRWL